MCERGKSGGAKKREKGRSVMGGGDRSSVGRMGVVVGSDWWVRLRRGWLKNMEKREREREDEREGEGETKREG